MAAKLWEPCRAGLQADGSILRLLEDHQGGREDIISNHKTMALRVLWCMQRMHI